MKLMSVQLIAGGMQTATVSSQDKVSGSKVAAYKDGEDLPKEVTRSSKKRSATCVQHQNGSRSSTAFQIVKEAKTAINPDVSLSWCCPCAREVTLSGLEGHLQFSVRVITWIGHSVC